MGHNSAVPGNVYGVGAEAVLRKDCEGKGRR
jgi:hypothetical protein